MRKLTLAVALALAPLLAGCNTTMFQQDIAAFEAQAIAVSRTIKSGAVVAETTIQSAIDSFCSQGIDLNKGAQNIKSGLLALGNGPKTQKNMAIADQSAAVLSGVCAAAPTATGTTLVRLFKEGLSAYFSYKGALTAATAAAASGS